MTGTYMRGLNAIINPWGLKAINEGGKYISFSWQKLWWCRLWVNVPFIPMIDLQIGQIKRVL